MGSSKQVVFALASCLLPLACDHGDPFRPPPNGTNEPLRSVGLPRRLTFNRGHDREVAWLSDGSAFIYTAQQAGFNENDWCLVVMPATGGRITRKMCATSYASRDSVNAWHWGAPGPGGRLAYVRESSNPGFLAPRFHEVVVTRWESPESATVVLALPYQLVAGNPLHGGVAQVRWLDSTTLVYRSDLRSYPPPCPVCAPDTVVSGRALVLVTLAGSAATFSVIPGSDYATSLAVRGDEVFYTRGGQTGVYLWSRTTGQTTLAWDFGSQGVARGVQVSGNLMVAVVGGAVGFFYHPTFDDSVQVDNGGFVRLVELDTGNEGFVDPFGTYRHPALSPDGHRLVVENVARAPDLFLFDLP